MRLNQERMLRKINVQRMGKNQRRRKSMKTWMEQMKITKKQITNKKKIEEVDKRERAGFHLRCSKRTLEYCERKNLC